MHAAPGTRPLFPRIGVSTTVAALVAALACATAQPALADSVPIGSAEALEVSPVWGEPFCTDGGGAAVHVGLQHDPADVDGGIDAKVTTRAVTGGDESDAYGHTDARGRYSTVIQLTRDRAVDVTVAGDVGDRRADGSVEWQEVGERVYTFPDGCLPGYPRMTLEHPVVGQDWIIDDPTVQGDARWDADKVETAPTSTLLSWSLNPGGELVATSSANYKFSNGTNTLNYGRPSDVYNAPPKPPVTTTCVVETGNGSAKITYGGVTRSFTLDSARTLPKVCLTPRQIADVKKKLGL